LSAVAVTLRPERGGANIVMEVSKETAAGIAPGRALFVAVKPEDVMPLRG
jgi:hypothetical protein